MLEALSMVTERDDVRSRWDTPAYKPLKYARSCYCHLAKRFACRCMDWSERREHLAGVFATRRLVHFIETGWLRKGKTGRALTETPLGVRALATLFVVDCA